MIKIYSQKNWKSNWSSIDALDHVWKELVAQMMEFDPGITSAEAQIALVQNGIAIVYHTLPTR
jgi:hypothetical protein